VVRAKDVDMSKQETEQKTIHTTKLKQQSDYSWLMKYLNIAFTGIVMGLVFTLLFSANHYYFMCGALIGGVSSFFYIKHGFHNKAEKIFKRTGVSPLIGFFFYFIWVIVWLIYVSVLSTGIEDLDKLIRPVGIASDFAISYSASSLDSLIFFLLVGFILTIIALKKPEEEKLNRKIEYIFPDVDSESKLLPYLVNSVSALACINTLSERVLTITEVSQDKKHLKISSKAHSSIKNIHNNTDYEEERMPWGFTVDVIKPDEKILGEVHELSIIDRIGNSAREKHIIKGIVQFTDKNREHSVTFPMVLTAGQEVIYQSNSWAWETMGNGFDFGISRYTVLQKFSISNATDEEIHISVTKRNEKTKTLEKNDYMLPKKAEKSNIIEIKELDIIYKDMSPDECIEIQFYIPEK
jgi:hypothetical protein